MESKKELTFERVFDAPNELVWKAWTDQELVKQWWGPRGVFNPICELDVKPNGLIHIVMEAGEELGSFKETKWPMTGKFEELDKPNKIVFSANAISNDKVILENLTTVTFKEENGKTKMIVHIVVKKIFPGAEQAISGMEQGWNQHLDKLGEFLRNEETK